MTQYHPETADELFLKGKDAANQGKISEAMALLQKAIEIDMEHGRAHNYLGWIYDAKLSDFDKAEEHYKLALRYSPEYAATYLNYAYLLNLLHRYDDNEALLKKAERVQSINLHRVYFEYGLLLELKGQYDQALKTLNKSLFYSLCDQDVNLTQQSIKRCQLKKEVLGENPVPASHSADFYYQEGDKKYQAKEYPAAIEFFKKAIEIDPQLAAAHSLMGYIYHWRLNEINKAEEHYKIAMKANEGLKAPIQNYASLLVAQKRWAEAMPFLEKALKNPVVDPAYIQVEYGLAYEAQENYSKAIEHFKKAVLSSSTLENMDFYKKHVKRCEEKIAYLQNNK